MTDYRRRNTLRYVGFDYTNTGAYFITFRVHRSQHIFGEVINGVMVLSPLGRIVDQCWIEFAERHTDAQVDIHVIMPNHAHVLLWIMDTGSAEPGAVSKTRKFGDAMPDRCQAWWALTRAPSRSKRPIAASSRLRRFGNATSTIISCAASRNWNAFANTSARTRCAGAKTVSIIGRGTRWGRESFAAHARLGSAPTRAPTSGAGRIMRFVPRLESAPHTPTMALHLLVFRHYRLESDFRSQTAESNSKNVSKGR